jgi:hypothetical protein
MNATPSSLVTFGIGGLAVLVAALFLAAVARVDRARLPRASVAVAVWLGGWLALAEIGVLARFDLRPPPLAALLVASLVAGVALGRSGLAGRVARGMPLAALVGFHAFRLPLELVMHRAAAEGVMPAQMSYGGWNYDVVTGATALILAPFADRLPRAVLLAWNVLGSTLLAVIVVVAVASTPLIHAFGQTPDRLNTFIAAAPFVWLPAVLVAAALAGHIVVFRALAAAPAAGPQTSPA